MGLFRSSSVTHASKSTNSTTNGSFLSRNKDRENEPLSPASGSHIFSRKETLTTAHSKLKLTIQAEKAADEALIKSRAATKTARIEITRLEAEAKAEAKAAQAKVATASKFRREGNKLH